MTQNKLRSLILALLCASGLLLSGCDTGIDPASNESVSTIASTDAATVSSQSSEVTTVTTVAPTLTPTPTAAFTFKDGDPTPVFRKTALILTSLEGLYYIGTEDVFLLPGSEPPELDMYEFWPHSWISGYSFSNDGSCVAAVPYERMDGLGTLSYCDGKKAIMVSENVDSYVLSDDGSTILYLTGFYEHGIGGSLYLYDAVTNASSLIAEDAGRLFTVSPSGNAYAYTTFSKENDPDSLQCYTCLKGEQSRRLGERIFPLALTDDAKLVYAQQIDRDGACLEIYENGEKIELFGNASEEYAATCLVFNLDYTQLIFAANGKTFLYMPGFTAAQVFEESITGLAQDFCGRKVADEARNGNYLLFAGTTDLCNVLFQNDPEIEDYDKTQVATNLSFDQNLQVTSEQVDIDEFNQKVDSFPTYARSWDPLRLKREGKPDYIFYLEVDESLPYHPEPLSDVKDVPYGDDYEILYRVEDKAGAVPVKVADLVSQVYVGDFGVVYIRYDGPYYGPGNQYSSYLSTTDVYHSVDGENFDYVFSREQSIGFALGG